MLFFAKEDYYNLDLEYYLDFENPADCKFSENVGPYEVLALEEGEVNNQIMAYTDDKFVGFVVDVPFSEFISCEAHAWSNDLIGKIKEFYVESFALPNGFSLVMSRPEAVLITIGLEQNNHFYDCRDVTPADCEEIVDELLDLFLQKKGA